MADRRLKAPFSWFGGKSLAAPLVWSRFGTDISNYVEPFFGSGAVWLARPQEIRATSVVNDLDGLLSNFWRSVKMFPAETAAAADCLVSEVDLTARHLWLVKNRHVVASRMMADHDYCDPVLAGWWAWGASCWIGGGWCSGKGAWRDIVDEEGYAVLAKVRRGGVPTKGIMHPATQGAGVNRTLDEQEGVDKKIMYLTHQGNGINNTLHAQAGVNDQAVFQGRQGAGTCAGSLETSSDGACAARSKFIADWFQALRDSLRETRVCCGDWERICTVATMTSRCNGSGSGRPCAVLLDPPYSTCDEGIYAEESSSVAHDVRRWCIANGDNKLLRIALCGHDGEHNELEALGWRVCGWKKLRGYRKADKGTDDRERIWFSPACLSPDDGGQETEDEAGQETAQQQAAAAEGPARLDMGM